MHAMLARAASLLAFSAVLLVPVQCQAYPRFERGDVVFVNNSYMFTGHIGEADNNVLKCVTDFPGCCSSAGSHSGSWFDEQGRAVQEGADGATTMYVTRGEGAVSLNRRANGGAGMWQCVLPDIHGVMQSLYIYIGTGFQGTLNSTSLSFTGLHTKPILIPKFTLTCRSEGGPATVVLWTRNGVTVQENSQHETSRVILDTSQNTVYENRLQIRGREGGEYKCTVRSSIEKYFPQLTYLAHSSSTLTVEVAREPRDFTVLWESDTSLLVSWTAPTRTPTGYVIYYQLDRGVVHGVNVSGGETESHLLQGLESGGNYNVSIVALSEHLPSAMVGSPIMPVGDSSPSVVVTTTEDLTAGSSFILNCTVTLLHGVTVVPRIGWEGPAVASGGVLSSVRSNGESHTRLLAVGSLALAHGGDYTCTANYTVNGETSLNTVVTTTVAVVIPQPSISVVNVGDETPYVGNDITLECTVQLHNVVNGRDVEVNLKWLKNGRVYNGQQERVMISRAVSSSATIRSTATFAYLLLSDSSKYRCQVSLVPLLGASSPLVASKLFQLAVIVPSLIVQSSPSLVRILDTPPYNQFILTCTAWAEVEGQNVPIQMSIHWTKRVESRSHTGSSVQFFRTPLSQYQTSGSPNDYFGYQSILTGNETDAENDILYRCQADIVNNPNSIQSRSSDSHLAVVGPTNPVLPVFVRVTDSSGSSATIQWMVSSIAYTPETYVVRYGTSLDDLNMTSGALYSGPNVRMVSRIYSIELSDLQPSTTYFYRVVTYNLFDQTASGVRSFLTEELLTVTASGDRAQVGHTYTLLCTVNVPDSEDTDIVSLIWMDSSGHILRTSNGSELNLELAFDAVALSDVGNYTCTVNYTNGDFRVLTEEVVPSVPLPRISVAPVSKPDVVYAGLNLTLRCDMTLIHLTDEHVHVSLEWLKNGNSFTSCSEVRRRSGFEFFCLMSFTHLSHRNDNGSYSCRVSLTPLAPYTFLKAHTVTSSSTTLQVAVPIVTVAIASSTTRLLDISPYNKFTGTCSVSVEVPELEGSLQLATRWQWRRKGAGDEEFSDIADTYFDTGNGVSTLDYVEVVNGSVEYQCEYSLEGVDSIYDCDEIAVSVIDARAPNLPEGHHTAELSPTTALIQWTVPSIAYTPETYVVEYGTSQDNLHIARGESLTSGDDIKAVGKVHTLELTGLSPGTKYYFVVAAYNSEKLSKNNPTFFYTVETAPGRVFSVEAVRVNDSSLNISWGAAHPTNGNITHYLVWVNSTIESHLHTEGHLYTVLDPTQRQLIVNGLTRKTTYKVYVAAVNGAGHGEWEETRDPVSTKGLTSDNSGGGTGTAVAAVVTVIVLLLLITGIIQVVILLLYTRKKRREKEREQRELRRKSSQLEKAAKEENTDLDHENVYETDPTPTLAVAGGPEEEEEGSSGSVEGVQMEEEEEEGGMWSKEGGDNDVSKEKSFMITTDTLFKDVV